MSDFITPALVGVISTLLTLLLTPRIQHYFWGYQRLSEIRLDVLKEMNNLAAEFLNNYIKDSQYRPTDQFFKALTITSANIKILYSDRAFKCFKEFEDMIGPNMGPTGNSSIEAFIETRDAALRALYKEAVAAKLF